MGKCFLVFILSVKTTGIGTYKMTVTHTHTKMPEASAKQAESGKA